MKPRMKLLFYCLIFFSFSVFSMANASEDPSFSITVEEEKPRVTTFVVQSSAPQMQSMGVVEVDSETLFHQGMVKYKSFMCCSKKNRIEAARLFKLSADQGHPEAQFRLGQLHQSGSEGVDQSNVEAMNLFILAANQGHPEAQFRLALMFEENLVGKTEWSTIPSLRELQRKVEIKKLFRMAAEQGHPKAKSSLSRRKKIKTPR